MASLSANLDDLNPSLFELLSEQQLSDLIPPSLRYLLLLATQRYPRYLLRAFNSFDEVYALLALVVERYYLRTFGGSFTENFYGLKRERVFHIKGGEATRARAGAPGLLRQTAKLTNGDVWKNLIILIGVPYLKRKLDQSYDIHVPNQSAVIQVGPAYRRDELPPNPSFRQRLTWYYKLFLRKVYPSVNGAYYLAILAFNLAYIFNNTKYSSPLLWLIGTRMRRLDEADYRAFAQAAANGGSQTARIRGGRASWPNHSMRALSSQMLSGLRLLLPASIFALKFLEWWHASDFARHLSKKSVEGLDLPPPTIAPLLSIPSDATKSSKAPDRLQDSSSSSIKTESNTVALSDNAAKSSALAASSGSKDSTPVTSTATVLSNRVSKKTSPPISASSNLPIYTMPAPDAATSSLCPICRHPIQTPTSAQTGYVFCYTCIFKWVDGSHEKQTRFMEGSETADGWGEELEEEANHTQAHQLPSSEKDKSRETSWESGMGRCAVTGMRVLGGTDGLRRVMV